MPGRPAVAAGLGTFLPARPRACRLLRLALRAARKPPPCGICWEKGPQPRRNGLLPRFRKILLAPPSSMEEPERRKLPGQSPGTIKKAGALSSGLTIFYFCFIPDMQACERRGGLGVLPKSFRRPESPLSVAPKEQNRGLSWSRTIWKEHPARHDQSPITDRCAIP